jgi:large repetitive protein
VQSVVLKTDQISHYRDGMLIDSRSQSYNTVLNKLVLGAELDSDPYLDMQVAAVLVYDRALTTSEQSQVQTYLQGKYITPPVGNPPPVAANDVATVVRSGSVVVSVLANDTDNSAVAPGTVEITQAPVAGSTLVNTGTGAITYTHGGGTQTSDVLKYRVRDDQGAWSNVATVNLTITDSAPVLPSSGLVLHLESDVGVATSGNTVTGWTDQSTKGNNLTAAGNPTLVAGAPSGALVVDFDGAGDKLERTAGLSGLPAGRADRTVYLVANYQSNGYGGFAYGTTACNQTFGTVVTPTGKLMVQGWCNDFISSVQGTGSGWLVQSVVLKTDQISHYRDGTLIDSRSQSYNTVLNKLVLGAELDSDPYLDMQVAAVLVYDRALTTSEQTQVQTYLQGKYITLEP